MGLFAGKPLYARNCDGQDRRDDPRQAQSVWRAGWRWFYGCLILWLCAVAAQAETLRVATYNAELSRRGPGLLLADIAKGKVPQVEAALQVIGDLDADVLVLTAFDYDFKGRALGALAARGVTRVLCEGGAGLAAGLIREGLVDDLILFSAGALIGAEGAAVLGPLGLAALSDAPRLSRVSTAIFGADVMTHWRFA